MAKRRTLGKRRRRNTQYTRTKNKTKYFRKMRGGADDDTPPPPPPMPRTPYTWPSQAPRPAAPLPPRLPWQSRHPKGDDTKRPKSQTP
jgi:hypothetical protein